MNSPGVESAPGGEEGEGGIVAWVDAMVGTIIETGGFGEGDDDNEQQEADRGWGDKFNRFSKSVNWPIKLKLGEIFGRIDFTRLQQKKKVLTN